MHDFEFSNPVKIFFGKNQIKNLAGLIPENKTVLLAYGNSSIKQNGLYTRIKNKLQNVKCLIEFGGIGPNPEYATLLKAVELCRQKQVEFILAVGGGSVIDGSKFIAAAINYTGKDIWQIMKGNITQITKVIPLGVVLTMPATGSEVNECAVISRRATTEKLAVLHNELFPKFAILDPEYTYSLPKQQLINGIVDPLIHVTEQYLTTDIDTPLQDGYAETIIKTLLNIAHSVINDNKNYSSRANWMWCASNALNNYIGLGVDQDWSTHAIGHTVTALYNLDHAQTLAIIAPQIWRYKKNQKQKKLLKFARNVWQISDNVVESAIDLAIKKTEHFFHAIGMKTTFKSYGIQVDAQSIAATVIKNTSNGALGEHRDIEYNDIVNIVNMAS